jgi:pyruvate/2-oxoglutarate dehydrogenase complex dihydrolipoamide dehydrogenase (E3) component
VPHTTSFASEADRPASERPFKRRSSEGRSRSSRKQRSAGGICIDTGTIIGIVTGRATFEDPFTLLVESGEGRRRLTAANILIAVGTMPSKPRGIYSDDATI